MILEDWNASAECMLCRGEDMSSSEHGERLAVDYVKSL